jgi:hypothetical protein
MRPLAAKEFSLPFGFITPEIANVNGIRLNALITAIVAGNQVEIAELRAQTAGDVEAFDQFVRGVRSLATGHHAAASNELGSIQEDNWRVASSILRVIALVAMGEIRQAISLANHTGDFVRASGMAESPHYMADRALLTEAVRCLQIAEGAFRAPPGALQIAPPFRYVIGYPRSGNTLLTQFLSFAFGAPTYSVYPGAGWYFSRRFHDPDPGHAVFVKDHILHPEYIGDPILSPIRDGRDAMVSLARYLYGEGPNKLVRRGELAGFLSYVVERMPYGFWGDHSRGLLAAKDRGARVELIRYEEIFRNYQGLFEIAHGLGGNEPVPHGEEASYLAFVAPWQKRLALQPQWSEGLELPPDSFIPPNWSIGGGTIDWRRAFDAPARRRFHDLGGTEMLIRLGYETDEDWWRQD